MPLRTTFRREQNLVIVEGRGEVSAEDLTTCIRMIDAAGAHRFAKLADLRRVTTRLAEGMVLGLVELVRSRESLGAGGALAVVVTDPEARSAAERVAGGAPTDRPIRVFAEIDDALRWLETQV
jgi:hypothetical protein